MKEKGRNIIALLEEVYPETIGTTLNWQTPLDLLVATILSAQSTDKQINKITASLFEKYRTAADYAYAPREQLENDIRSSGFFRRKADAIQESCRVIIEEHGGEVPSTMDELTNLKGAARKTANIVLGSAFGIIEGIAVDTHVWRLSHRLRLSDKKNRNKIEKDLMEVFDREKWLAVNYLLIEHGRRVCDAKKPDCATCILCELCPSAFTFRHNTVG
ncbi:MAG: endonuclease III [Candidatus Bathyarchaeota archaeon]|jgi:endonuclease-3|nr:endonuclease III [Candidatus Bathyarchaeota archaeon]